MIHIMRCDIDNTIPLIPYSKPLAIFCGCTAWFVWDLVGNPEDRFSLDVAHIALAQENLPKGFPTS